MLAANTAGVPHRFQARVSAQVVYVPVWPHGALLVVLDASA
jgi:hypothetical protein